MVWVSGNFVFLSKPFFFALSLALSTKIGFGGLGSFDEIHLALLTKIGFGGLGKW